ncbi:MAG: pantoate--beta-alanine ligase [Bacillota bacterium]|nr:pantoate--beta-alanine ligase [Bacillota bacterium]
MLVIRTADALRRELGNHTGKKIGLVPTMGYLHRGHLSLVEKSRNVTDITVVTIFVNPTQFGPNEDFESYPRDEKRDLEMLEKAGADIVFVPTVKEIYPEGNATDIVLHSDITRKLCAKTRPTHFDGVTNVVSRFLCLVKPHYAFFGRKDAQQLAIIQRMTKDLLIGTEIVGCPIVREEDGLALSSRNTYLSDAERKNALSISRSLFAATEALERGAKVANVKTTIAETIEAAGGKVDYVAVVDPATLEDLDVTDGDYMIAIAAFFGKTRLIDNRARIDGQCI